MRKNWKKKEKEEGDSTEINIYIKVIDAVEISNYQKIRHESYERANVRDVTCDCWQV